jgi:hypothetical protein
MLIIGQNKAGDLRLAQRESHGAVMAAPGNETDRIVEGAKLR